MGAAWLSVSSEIDQSQRNLQAQLGITASEAKKLGQIGQEVFKNNWGGSIEEASAAVGEVKKLFGSLAGDELQAVTEQAFAMNAAFGGDLESTLAGAQRLAGAFGVTAGEAMDILAKGAQVTGEPLQEVSLLFQEYSGHLAQLGIDGPTALSAIQSGLANGAFEGDKVLDMFKEMNLKLTEGSTATQAALSRLGLTDLIDGFRAGEVTGVEAFQKIQAALGEFEGNIPADILADALGTPAEDLGQEAVLAIDLMGASLGNIEGAAIGAGDAVSNSIGGAFEALKRTALVSLAEITGTDAFGSLKDTAIAAINGASAAIETGADMIKEFIADLNQAWEDDWGGIRSAAEDVMAWWEAEVVPILEGDLEELRAAIAEFGVRWETEWKGKIEPAVRAFIDFWNSTVAPAITLVLNLWKMEIAAFQSVIAGLAEVWRQHGDSIMAVVGPLVTYVVQQFQFLMDFIRGIVQAGSALIQGDFRGFGEGLGRAAGAAVGFIVNVFKTTWTLVKSALSAGVAAVQSWFAEQGKKSSDNIKQGLIEGIKSGAGAVITALKEMASGMVKGFMDALVMHSPSKVFEQLGQWITIGLASGIQKEDQKAVAALADIIAKMSSVASGLADFGKKIAEMIVPSDQQIAAAKEKYLRMTMIITDFVKSISYLGALLPVANVSKAEPGQVKAINAGLTQLSQSFPAIKELQGMTADKLLTGGEASWASMLADTVGKIAGVWGGIADSMTKIATAKFPTDAQLQSIKESTIRIATWAMGVLDQPMITSLGAEEFAKAIKGVVDALATVAGLDLADITRVVQEQLDIAKSNIELIGKWGYQIVTDWLKVAGDDKARAAWIASLKDFADTTAAAANILKAGDVGNLADIAAVTQGQLDVARANIGAAGRFAWELVTAWVKNAGDATTRAAWIADLKDFADTIGAAVSIFKAGADASGKLGELTTIAEGAFDIIKQNLIDIGSNVASMAEWTFGFTDTFKAWADDMKTAVDVFRAGVDASGALGELTSIGGDALEIVKQNVIDIASTVSALAEWSFTWPEDFKTWADNVKTALDIFKGGADASKTLADVSSIPQHQFEIVKQNIIDIASAMSDTAAWEFSFPETFAVWAGNVKTALDIFKAGADASKTLEDVSSIAVHQFDIIKQNVIDIATAMSDLSQWEFAFPDTFDVWGKNVTMAVGIFAAVAKSIADIGSTQVSDIAGKLAPMKAAIVAMLKMIGEIAQDIGVEEAKARAELAEAIGRAGGALGDFGGGIGGIMELVQSKLFGSDASRGGLGFTQRTKTNRADFFATQLTDTVKRAVGAVQDALAGISIQPNDPKVTAIGQLGEAFGKLADGLTKLAEAKLPSADQLAAIMGATGGASLALAGAAGGGGGAGPTVTGMGGGDMYIQYGNNVIVTDADDQQGLIEALKASIR